MSIPRWTPNQEPTKQEQLILKRLKRVRKLFAFLRRHRHELFDDEFQDELESMYRKCGAGQKPLPPAMLAMAVLVQGYLGLSDAEMVELTVMDLRIQMVLGTLGQTEPAFSQGALCLRHPLIKHRKSHALPHAEPEFHQMHASAASAAPPAYSA